MNNFNNFLSLSKILAAAIGNKKLTERDVVFECLKFMADQRNDWTQEQKDYYEMMIDLGNEIIKNQCKIYDARRI